MAFAMDHSSPSGWDEAYQERSPPIRRAAARGFPRDIRPEPGAKALSLRGFEDPGSAFQTNDTIEAVTMPSTKPMARWMGA